MTAISPLAQRVLHWFDQHGRHDLPWQRDTTAYRVWVSEIMLQQTQVKTVIPYFKRFTTTFPDVQTLANAPQDEVLHLWTGLGYYARARNLHRAAQQICTDLGGEFPTSVDDLCQLPGVGRSTAGAILSIAGGQRAVILDGNVKRVLCRYRAVDGWPGNAAIQKILWRIAGDHTPAQRCADYNQAMMDLGATVCTRGAPQCTVCPLERDCRARQLGRQSDFPEKKPRKTLPVKTTTFVMATAPDGNIWLQRRPPSGIWGGLWCFPQIDSVDQVHRWCNGQWGIDPDSITPWPTFRHTFSHYHLDIQPVRVVLAAVPGEVMEGNDRLWYNSAQPPAIGLAAPVASLLKRLA